MPSGDAEPRKVGGEDVAPKKWTCAHCKEILDLKDFLPKKNARGHDGVCRKCRKAESGENINLTDRAARAMCFDKNRYGSMEHAVEVAAAAVMRGKKQGLRPYSCPVCGKYHLTSKVDK